jgi:hypothetical protein
MCVDGSITRGASEVFVLTIGNMELSRGVLVFLSQTEINDVDLVATLVIAHEEVIGLDVAVEETLGMDVFYSGDELISENQDGLQREFSVAEVEEVLQAWPEEI